MPQHQEKELFTVVVHEDQFVVPARRIPHLLQVQQPFPEWLHEVCYLHVLEEGQDYFYRKEVVLLNLLAIKKIVLPNYAETEEADDSSAKMLFRYCASIEHHLLHVTNKHFGNFLISTLHWRYRNGIRLYKLSSVLKGLQQPNAAHQEQVMPQHFTRIKEVTYISQYLTQYLCMKKWVTDAEALLKDTQPFLAEL